MAPKRHWHAILPEPFWPTLAALLMIAALTAVPLYALCVLVWPNVSGSAATLMAVGCYVVAVPLTWWVLRSKQRR